jgi:hypothetical protein
MKDDIVERGVIIMLMPDPIGGIDMDLHIPGPQGIPYPYPGIEKIRTCVRVMPPGIND